MNENKYCEKCGNQLLDEAIMCPKCGCAVAGKQPTKEQAFSKLLPRCHNGAVILLHSTSQTNAEILDELLTKWEAAGYRFETIDQLFA